MSHSQEDREVLLQVTGLKTQFVLQNSLNKNKRKVLRAVDGVDLTIHKGEIVGVVGESGCGKSTLGRTILGLQSHVAGSIQFHGTKLEELSHKEIQKHREKLQMIFQDPNASLNPRMTIFESVKAALDVYHIGTKKEREERVIKLLDYMGLREQQIYKYPHQLSGGQCQRVVIARAIILNPEFVVCDEPVSALDVSVRSQVLNLMKDLQQERNLSYLFISHDLSVVRYLCDTVAVMYLGKILEIGSKQEIFEKPMHPYTVALLSAIPIPAVNQKRRRIVLEGDVPSPIDVPSGCRFYNRCPYATKECSECEPELMDYDDGHQVACIKAGSYSSSL